MRYPVVTVEQAEQALATWSFFAARTGKTFKALVTKHARAVAAKRTSGTVGRFAVTNAEVEFVTNARRAAHYANIVLDAREAK